jgi:hypothetical protein
MHRQSFCCAALLLAALALAAPAGGGHKIVKQIESTCGE